MKSDGGLTCYQTYVRLPFILLLTVLPSFLCFQCGPYVDVILYSEKCDFIIFGLFFSSARYICFDGKFQ